jgi:phospholipid/cholesterol/gamma-HCH transport system substrate-binding protein
VSDYETTQRRRNIVVGIFMITGLCALVWMIFKFGDLPGFVAEVNSFQVFVQFPTATGIEKDAPVRFCGYQVGRVTSVMAPEERTDLDTGLKYYQAVVVLSIDKRYAAIPSCVQVKLMTRGLGSSYIELKQCPGLPVLPQEPNRPETKYLVNGMWLQGSTGMTSEFFPEESQQKLNELIDGINNFIANANEIIGDQQSKENIKKTLANAAEASEQAKKTMKQFETLAAAGTTIIEHTNAKVDQVVTTLTETGEQIQKFAAAGTTTLEGMDAKSQKLVTSLVDTSEQLSAAMAELRLILDKINNGQGTAAKLLNDGRLYENLLENTNQLQKVLEEMKAFIADWRNKKVGVKLF